MKLPNSGLAREGRRGEGDDRDRADDHQRDAEPEIEPLVADEARGDALVDDIALLEEQLPGRDRRADEADDDQHHVAELAGRNLRHDQIARNLRERRMGHEIDRDQQKAGEDEQHRKSLEAPEVAGADGDHDQRRRDDDARGLVEAEETVHILGGATDRPGRGGPGEQDEVASRRGIGRSGRCRPVP